MRTRFRHGGTRRRETRRFWKGAKAALNLSFGLGVGGDAVGNAEVEQCALELGADVVGPNGWSGSEKDEAISIIGARSAVTRAAPIPRRLRVREVIPCLSDDF